MSRSSPEAVALILSEEGFAGRPYWPGAFSGVTLDPGYDLGRHSLETYREDWAGLPGQDRAALEVAIGVRGEGAHQLIEQRGLSGIPIPRALALQAFTEDSMPGYEADVIRAMPGADELTRTAFGALASLIYNRGPAMEDNPDKRSPDDRRLELRMIRQGVAAFAATTLISTKIAALHGIARQLDLMGERLWPGTNRVNQTLRKRRHKEADLVRQAADELAKGTIP